MRYSPIALLVACTLAASASHAEPNSITFEGEVTDQTCEVTIDGNTATTVTLPTVQQKELDANTVAGETQFLVSITGCQADKGAGKNTVQVKLHHANISEQGNLVNSDSNAKGIAVQLFDNDQAINLKTKAVLPIGTIDATHLKFDKTFTAKYIKEGDITPGKVKAVAQYELNYL